MVYPRVGGGNRWCCEPPARLYGLSPRGRGKPCAASAPKPLSRSIPAWAGETRHPMPIFRQQRVYPRVGGGNRRRPSISAAFLGLSPRGRGKLERWSGSCSSPGSIPAWAGETAGSSTQPGRGEVYPRVGGGNRWAHRDTDGNAGLSPRGRGKPRTAQFCLSLSRSIPAWAGETFADAADWCEKGVYPRVGGGNTAAVTARRHRLGLSPRGRGKPTSPARRDPYLRSIPAWAGETPAGVMSARHREVYPRVGGGNLRFVYIAVSIRGLSPRGRGKPSELPSCAVSSGSIPAWAGETR